MKALLVSPHLSTRLAIHRPPVPSHEAVVHCIESLTVLGEAGPGLLIARHTLVLHDAAHQRHKVGVFPSLAPHPTAERALGVTLGALGEAGEDLRAGRVSEALHHLSAAPGHHAQEALAQETGEGGAKEKEAE